MDEKDLKELRELIEFLKANDIAEFDMEREDLKVRLKFAVAVNAPAAVGGLDMVQLAHLLAASKTQPAVPSALPVAAVQHAPSEASTATPAPAAEADPLAGAHIVKSPIVGTFYDAPAPDAETFVKVGDNVRAGQVLCIVEAMKLMNDIESDAAGEIIKIFPATGQPVEYGQPLFAIKK